MCSRFSTTGRERAVPHSQKSRSDSLEIDHPKCDACGSQMWLRKISKDGSGDETRMFECPVCEISTGECDHLDRGIKAAK